VIIKSELTFSVVERMNINPKLTQRRSKNVKVENRIIYVTNKCYSNSNLSILGFTLHEIMCAISYDNMFLHCFNS